MEIGFVGLGKMGLNMVTRLRRGGHRVVAIAGAEESGAARVEELPHLAAKLAAPRPIWVMIPAGAPTETTVSALGDLLSANDAIVDGGNTNFQDDVRRATALKAKGIAYVD